MKYLQEVAQNLGKQLIKSRRYNYSEQMLQNFLIDNINLSSRFTKIENKRKQHLQTLLVKNNKQNPNKTCIIYAHGLGSNKLQALPILKFFTNFSYDIFSFDFSGSGKSQGKYTSYGLRQQDDLCAVLSWLDNNQNYENYILWGRSMGSVAIVLSQSLILNSKVKGIILDSPFSSFQKISLQIASRKSYIPEFFLQPLLSYLKSYYEQKSEINPFKVNIIQKIKKIQRQILFIYSKNDTIVSYNHSKTLKLNCSQNYSEIQISQDHNMQRSKQTHRKINEFIQKILQKQKQQIKFTQSLVNNNQNDKIDFDKTMKFQIFSNRRSQSRNRGISLTSKQSIKQNLQYNGNGVRKSTGGNHTKINLIITTSMTLKRNDSFKNNQNPIKLKPVSSVNLGSKQQYNFVQKNQPSLYHPLSVTSLNSIDTIQSNAEQPLIKNYQSIKNKQISFIKKDLSFLDITQKFTSFNQSTNMNINMTKINYPQKQTQKSNSFHLTPFLNEDLNMMGAINSICLNRRKIKGKQDSNLLKDKTNITYLKRPNIQLSRKNRFVV